MLHAHHAMRSVPTAFSLDVNQVLSILQIALQAGPGFVKSIQDVGAQIGAVNPAQAKAGATLTA